MPNCMRCIHDCVSLIWCTFIHLLCKCVCVWVCDREKERVFLSFFFVFFISSAGVLMPFLRKRKNKMKYVNQVAPVTSWLSCKNARLAGNSVDSRFDLSPQATTEIIINMNVYFCDFSFCVGRKIMRRLFGGRYCVWQELSRCCSHVCNYDSRKYINFEPLLLPSPPPSRSEINLRAHSCVYNRCKRVNVICMISFHFRLTWVSKDKWFSRANKCILFVRCEATITFSTTCAFSPPHRIIFSIVGANVINFGRNRFTATQKHGHCKRL